MAQELNLELESTDENGVPITLQHLHGVVLRTVFENPQNGYTVVRLDVKGREVTLVGMLAGVHAGEEMDVEGKWEAHKEYGRQFLVKSFRMTLPSTPKGIVKYLASGVLPGIGEKTAELIVKQFGEETIEILNNRSAMLKQVPGIGRKRLEQIRQTWQNESARRDQFIFLHSLGIGTGTCQKLYRVYGSRTGALIKENPYRLADDVNGIGFLSADRIADELGVTKDSPLRIRAGILYSIKQLIGLGHTCYPLEQFLPYTAALLEQPAMMIEPYIELLNSENVIAVEQLSQNAEKMVYDVNMHKLECEFVGKFKKLQNQQQFAGRRISGMQTLSNVAFSDEQIAAVNALGKAPITIITGGPGVGKTTVIAEICNRAKRANLRIALAAPTGRAAKRMSESTSMHCSTIHRMLKWIPGSNSFEYGTKKALPCQILVIDEVSMLDLPLATYVFRAIDYGCSVVLVGDANQLPSVGAGRVLHDLIGSGLVPCTHLSRIYRQAQESRIITNAHLINEGRMPVKPDLAPGAKSDFYWIEQNDPIRSSEQIIEMVSSRIPHAFGFDPMRDIQVLAPMNRGECGVISLNTKLQQILNGADRPNVTIGDRMLKVGDRVMQTSNNYDLNVFNGDLGRITEIYKNNNDHFLTVDYEGRSVVYPISNAHELVLAYAITVHKSQGSEFPCVILPMLSQHYIMLQRNLLYTGVTRAKKLLILIGSSKAIGMAVHNIRQEPRYTTLKERLKSDDF